MQRYSVLGFDSLRNDVMRQQKLQIQICRELCCESAIISVDENRKNRLVADGASSATSLSALKFSRANMTAFFVFLENDKQAPPALVIASPDEVGARQSPVFVSDEIVQLCAGFRSFSYFTMLRAPIRLLIAFRLNAKAQNRACPFDLFRSVSRNGLRKL